jgi:fatty-acid peroxygenase
LAVGTYMHGASSARGSLTISRAVPSQEDRTAMPSIPRDPTLDSTLAILKDGYNFIWRRCQKLESDAFVTRVLGLSTVCVHGPEATKLFYDESKFQRAHALPRRVVSSLFGKHAVHTLDDEEHRHRKLAFMSLMTLESMQDLMDIVAEEWRRAIRRWEQAETVVLFDEVQQILTRAVCCWAGVTLDPGDVPRRARDLSSMVDSFGGLGPRLWKGKLARVRSELWVARQIESVRRGRRRVPLNSALSIMAKHRDRDGKPLGARTAAVELLNVLRPTVAISWYITFAALALHQHPAARERIKQEPVAAGAGEYADMFMQEVRRFYPFTPFLGAMVRTPFEWRGHRFSRGTPVLLDVYGALHDPKLWDEPDQFRPERFEHWSGSAFDFIPQGGGHRTTGHRCPGEWITMHNVTLALHFLTRCASYELVPGQDLTFDLSRMPTRPESGLVIRRVRATEALDSAAPCLPSPSAAHDGTQATRESQRLVESSAVH